VQRLGMSARSEPKDPAQPAAITMRPERVSPNSLSVAAPGDTVHPKELSGTEAHSTGPIEDLHDIVPQERRLAIGRQVWRGTGFASHEASGALSPAYPAFFRGGPISTG
jgi:hypothetical protein